MVCPICHAEMQDGGAGRLDMSGERYLPAQRWVCVSQKCDETIVSVPTGEPEKPYEWVTEAP